MSQVVNVKLSRFERQPWGFREGPTLIKTIFFYLANDIFCSLKTKRNSKTSSEAKFIITDWGM
jgi:hypothetical protein